MSSLAETTREAVRERPFLYDALRAGVVNYTAAARYLDVEGETDAVATALRRFADELPDLSREGGDARVSMESGLGETDTDDPLLSVGGTGYAAGAGSLTGLVATGDVTAADLRDVLGRLAAADVGVEAAGTAGDALVVVVGRRDGPDALRIVEGAL
ncbi:MAG: hypothetical protein ABEH35_02050 [Haloarculaceae archaeon]